MDPLKTITDKGHKIELYWFGGRECVYVDNKLYKGTYEEAVKEFSEGGR